MPRAAVSAGPQRAKAQKSRRSGVARNPGRALFGLCGAPAGAAACCGNRVEPRAWIAEGEQSRAIGPLEDPTAERRLLSFNGPGHFERESAHVRIEVAR